MTKRELRALLDAAGQGEPVDGYNYAIFSVQHPKVSECPGILVANLGEIQRQYREKTGNKGWTLLPFVLRRSLSTVVPIPFDTELNTLGNILLGMVGHLDRIHIPMWG